MDVSIKIGTKSAVKWLNGIAEKQIPFAAMNAANTLAMAVEVAESKALPQHLDRPTPFTQRAYVVVRATNRAAIMASVRAKQIQGEYLKYQVFGGSRAPKSRANVTPADLKANQYGNMPKGAIKRMMADKRRYFSGSPGGRVAGLWRRDSIGRGKSNGDGLTLMVKWVGTASYDKQLPFFEVANATCDKLMRPVFDRQLADALASAR